MKITTKAVFQMTDVIGEYVPVAEESFEYEGPLAEAGGKAPDPPDYGPISDASEKAAELQYDLGIQQLDWAKEQWASQEEMLNSVLGVQIPIMEMQYSNAMSDRQRYEQVFQPLEDNLINDFLTYDSPARRELEAGRAASDVARSFEAQRQAAIQNLESYGVDPSTTRSQALDMGYRAQQAAAMAAAQNQSRLNTEAIGRSLRADAINIGRGMPSQVAQSYGQSLLAGNSAMGNMNNTLATNAALTNSAQGWFGGGNQSLGVWGNALTNGYNAQMQQYNANQAMWSGIGGLIGTGIGMFAEGGAVPEDAQVMPAVQQQQALPSPEGLVRGPGGPKGDKIRAALSDNEYVIPAEVVRRKGTDYFDRQVSKVREDMVKEAAEKALKEKIAAIAVGD